MNPRLQSVFLGSYRWAVACGLMSTPWGRRLFETAYVAYKRAFEAGNLGPLRRFVTPGSTVIDVGANIGFFTTLFASWSTGAGRVIAIEPEEVNFAALRRLLAKKNLDAIVEPLRGVAAEATGTLCLALNPHHPGDHRIADCGIPVPAFSLDDLLSERGWPPVSLIKIDVQGAEARVLAGAWATIERFHPTLFIEVDDDALGAMGTTAGRLFETLAARGYRIHRLAGTEWSPPLSSATAEAVLRDAGTYLDFLFIHETLPDTVNGVGDL